MEHTRITSPGPVRDALEAFQWNIANGRSDLDAMRSARIAARMSARLATPKVDGLLTTRLRIEDLTDSNSLEVLAVYLVVRKSCPGLEAMAMALQHDATLCTRACGHVWPTGGSFTLVRCRRPMGHPGQHSEVRDPEPRRPAAHFPARCAE